MLVTLTEFNTFMNDYETSDNVNALKTNCILSAQKIVQNYLNYELEEKTILESFTNIYNDFICVKNYITKINSLVLDSVEVNSSNITYDKYYIYITNYTNYKGIDVKVSYDTGYNSDTCPELIKLTILQIGTLIYMQTNKNIGITGLLGQDGISRTFINYTNFDKYLINLNGYKRI